MKNNFSAFAMVLLSVASLNTSLSQNTVPEEGNVGIGTTTPETALDVAGSVKIDSTLTVLDSIIVSKNARVKEDITVEGRTMMQDDATAGRDLTVEGDSYLKGKVVFQNGDVFFPYLLNSLADDDVLTIDNTGKVIRRGVKSLIYAEQSPSLVCPQDINGNPLTLPPLWTAIPNKLYTSSKCVPDPMVGIGTVPTAKLHIITAVNKTTYPLLIEKQLPGNNSYQKLLQLETNGLLRAREIKVDLATWPDYVFENDYKLLTLEELADYVHKNKHLPNVPSACEMESEGMNIAETNVMLMEKVEEFTLYLIRIQEQLTAQESVIGTQQTLLKQQQETLLLQQQLIEQLQQRKN